MFKSLILILTSVVVLSISAVADVPQLINFQGQLLDSAGAPVADGGHFLKFVIWNDPVATDALNMKWNSTIQVIDVSGGLFEYQLGSVVPLPDGLFSNDTILYLGITEGTNPEMLPRTKLVSVGYAFHALRADTADIAKSADSSATVSDNAITSAKITDGSIGSADINTTQVQQRVTGTAAAGQAIQAINSDGSIIEVAVGDGDITGVTAGSGLSGGGVSGDVTLEVDSGAINTLHITDGTVGSVDINSSQVQERVANAAPAGQAIRAISIDGAITSIPVGTGDITGVTAGSGLSGGGVSGAVTLDVTTGGITSSHIANATVGSADINTTQVQRRVSGTAAAGQAIRAINTDGSITAIAVGTGDITGVSAGSGLIGGGTSGSVTLSVTSGGITSTHIANSTITNSDISSSAGIATSKISGTAVNLSSFQTITGSKIFTGSVLIGDSTFNANNNGITIGDGGTPNIQELMFLKRRYNTASFRIGLRIRLINEGTAPVLGFLSEIGFDPAQGHGSLTSVTAKSSGGSGASTGLFADAFNIASSTNNRYGVKCRAGSSTNTGGISYGIFSEATAGVGSTAYGVYGTASGSGTRYAGWFQGDTHVTGTLSKGGGSFKIDHPLDPENKYLQHSFVESPDMMNVYNGNVVLDVNGEAIVNMPDYFEVLNKDFRYQLTAIGAPGPNLYIAEKISSNQFSIAGGDPYSEVSWQVTGVRQDKWAEKNRIQVELDKPAKELGLYMHYEEYGFGIERSIHKEQLELDKLEQERNESNNAFE